MLCGARAAGCLMFGTLENSMQCPVKMTDVVVPALRRDAGLRQRIGPLLRSREDHPSSLPASAGGRCRRGPCTGQRRQLRCCARMRQRWARSSRAPSPTEPHDTGLRSAAPEARCAVGIASLRDEAGRFQAGPIRRMPRTRLIADTM